MISKLKKTVLLSFIIFLQCLSSFAQLKMTDLAEGQTKLTFFGYDFTQVRFIGSSYFRDTSGLRDYFMPEWNRLIFVEERKYSLQGAFKLKPVKYSSSIDIVNVLNHSIAIKLRIIDEAYTITEEQAKKAIEQYHPDAKEGIGCSIVVEALDRPAETIRAWIVFFDMKTMQVLMTEKLEGKTRGISMRNYYAAGFANITEKIAAKRKVWTAQAK